MSENSENCIDNDLLLQYNNKCQQGQPPKDKDFLKKEVFKMLEKKLAENGNEIKEMKYAEYKTNYIGFDTVPGSYNAETKTIKVIVANYDKKVEIIDKLINDLKPNENDGDKMEMYKKYISNVWNSQTHENKVKALTPHKLAPNAIDARLNDMRDTLIRIAKKYELI